MWPTIAMENTDGVERVYDLPSRLLKDRIILVTEEINPATSTSIVAQLLALEAEDADAPITMYINSPGGSITDGMAIYDIMNRISCPIITIGVGMAASMGAVLLSSGTKGMRYCTPNATVMIHQPLGGVQGQATEIEIVAQRILKLRKKLYSLLAKNAGVDFEVMARACERDNYLEAEEALKLGLVDKVLDYPIKAWGAAQKGEEV